jgi:hypothetical protein
VYPGREAELEAMLAAMFPNASKVTLRAAVRDLQAMGTARLPREYVRVNLPELRALRLFDDVWFRGNVTDVQRAPLVVVRSWLTKAEVLEWAERDEWNDQFVAELIGEDGTTGQRDNGTTGQRDYGDGKAGRSALDDMQQVTTPTAVADSDLGMLRRGLYEVLWAYSRAATEDGAVGVYCTVMSGLCSVAGTEKRLIEDRTGEYPFVLFRRERKTRRVTESRGVPELVVTQQKSLKLLADSFEDHVQVTTNPPLKVPPGSARYQVALMPFGQIDSNPRAPVEFLERPPYPTAAEKHRVAVQFDIDDFWGRESELVPPQRRLLKSQHRVNVMLAALSEVLMKAVQLCQRYMTDEDMVRVARTTWTGRSTKEIQGRFDLQVSFDVRDMDSEFLMKKGELIMKYARPLDTRGTVPWELLVRNIVEQIDPAWAEMLPAPDAAMMQVRQDEMDAYLKVINGVEPEMPEKIEAPQMRLQVLQEMHAPRMQNPGAFAPMTPAAQAMLENRAKYLQQQATQQENAVIGRVGAKPVDTAEI